MVLKTRRPNKYCRDAHFCRQQEQMRGQRQSSYTPNSMAVQLHTKLYSSPATHQTLWQSSYTPNSTAVQLHTKLYGSPATHQTLQQQGGTGKDSYIHLADWTLSVAAIEKNPISTLYLLLSVLYLFLSVPSISLSLTVSSPLLLLVPSASYCQSLVPLTVSTLC